MDFSLRVLFSTAAKDAGKSSEIKRKSKSRVLCCYGNDPDEATVQLEDQKTKVEESTSSPINGHAERLPNLTDAVQASKNTVTPPGTIDNEETKINTPGDDVIQDDVTYPNQVSESTTNSKIAVEAEVLETSEFLAETETNLTSNEPDEAK